jgi:hypothetical protein
MTAQRTVDRLTAKDATIAASLECQRACEAAIGVCLSHPEMLDIAHESVRRALDCAAICGLCASMLGRGSDLTLAVCAVCAAACEHCAAEAQQSPDEPWVQCAEACLACAEQCRKMAELDAEGA